MSDTHAASAAMNKTAELSVCMPLNVLVIGATGRLGMLVARYAIQANHSVSVFVRSEVKLNTTFHRKLRKKLAAVFEGDALDLAAVASAVGGQDVVIECLSDERRPEAMEVLLAAVAAAGVRNLLAMGATTALLLESGAPAGPALGLTESAALHLDTLQRLNACAVPCWVQVCPSRMVWSPDRKASGHFTVRPTYLDLQVFGRGVDLYYEDVATAMVNIVDVQESGFSKCQMAFHLVDRTPIRQGIT